MRLFNHVKFDSETEVVTLGAGSLWGEVEHELEKLAKGYAGKQINLAFIMPQNTLSTNTIEVPCARIPYLGVAGSILHGGFSWLSHEYGLISDPQNLLDAQIVLRDGRVLWTAEEEPELLWALRGGGGNFGGLSSLPFLKRLFGILI